MSIRTRPAALALQSLILAALVGGASAWSITGKTVALSVDGDLRTVATHGSTVRDVLDAAHLTVGAHDLLAPASGTKVQDGARVVLRRGREMTLVVDGAPRTVWVTAGSVAEALDQIGVRAQGAVLSADRSRAIPLRGFLLDVRLPKHVQVRFAGALRETTTTDRTVGEVLRRVNIRLVAGDRIDAAITSTVHDGQVITVTQVIGRHVSTDAQLPVRTESHPDETLFVGQSRVAEPGHVGVLRTTSLLLFTNGKLTDRWVESVRRVVEPRARILGVGTMSRPVPVAVAPSAPAPAQRSSPAGSTNSGGLNWGALANCESGGDSRSVDGGGSYRGLYQFSIGTWQSVGGSGDPIDASPGEQTLRAQLLYQREGRAPWPVCGRYL